MYDQCSYCFKMYRVNINTSYQTEPVHCCSAGWKGRAGRSGAGRRGALAGAPSPRPRGLRGRRRSCVTVFGGGSCSPQPVLAAARWGAWGQRVAGGVGAVSPFWGRVPGGTMPRRGGPVAAARFPSCSAVSPPGPPSPGRCSVRPPLLWGERCPSSSAPGTGQPGVGAGVRPARPRRCPGVAVGACGAGRALPDAGQVALPSLLGAVGRGRWRRNEPVKMGTWLRPGGGEPEDEW